MATYKEWIEKLEADFQEVLQRIEAQTRSTDYRGCKVWITEWDELDPPPLIEIASGSSSHSSMQANP